MQKHYRLTVKDQAGVLDRITGYLRRNGQNIHEIHAVPLPGSDSLSTIDMTLIQTKAQSDRLEEKLRYWNFIFEVEEDEQP